MLNITPSNKPPLMHITLGIGDITSISLDYEIESLSVGHSTVKNILLMLQTLDTFKGHVVFH